jgi:anti-sigma regulatory factor (Ser/Thr protein kinase)
MAKRKSRQDPKIRDFILRTIPNEPVAVGARAAQAFGLSRTSTNRYLKSLEEEGLITAEGKTSARRYSLKTLAEYSAKIRLTPDVQEDRVWMEHLQAQFEGVPDNIQRICHYGFTEMFNNAIDHSESPDADILFLRDYLRIQIMVVDHGVGIFNKIKRAFDLPDTRSALLELSKGKLTSDKTRHSGEGIFFTSRMFNRFSILSSDLCYMRQLTDDRGWLIDIDDIEHPKIGTTIDMMLNTDAAWTPSEVFDKFQNEEMDFAKTHVPVALSRYGSEQLVSRSQAKRLLARFDRFEEVLLDFRGVNEIGQAFADEIFRVYATAHPNIEIIVVNAGDAVKRMIAHALASNPSAPNVTF